MKSILAIDQASNISGFARFEEEKLVEYATLDVSSGGKAMNRMVLIADWVIKKCQKHKVTKVILEDVTLQNDAKYRSVEGYEGSENSRDNIITFKTLSKLLGIIEYCCMKNNIECEVIPPTTWRSKCGIQGVKRDKVKQAAKAFVLGKWGINVDEDCAEAIGLGYASFVKDTPQLAFGKMP